MQRCMILDQCRKWAIVAGIQMQKRTYRACRRVAAGLLTPLLVVSGLTEVNAQGLPVEDSEATPSLKEVVVTVERRETVLRKTPMSVGVVGEAEIEAKGVAQLSDLVALVPGVAVPNGFSNQPQAVGIRGVGVSLPAMSQAVGIYVDDVPLVRGYANALWDLPDMERIEVLRGPQGTLYGQNLTAGAVKLISADPTVERSAWLSAGFGSQGAREVHGFATGAIGGTAEEPTTASIAFSRRSNDGFGHNATLNKDVNRLDATQFRAKFRWQTSGGNSVVWSIDGLKDTSDTNTSNFPLNDPRAAPRVTFTAVDAGAFKRIAGGTSLKITSQVNPDTVFKSITALRGYRDDPTVADFGGLAVQRYTLSQTVEQRTLSQELQLQRDAGTNQWTVGLMFIADNFAFDRFLAATPPGAPATRYTEAQTYQQTRDVGLYGQLRHAFSAQTALTMGLRAYHTQETGFNRFWLTQAQQVRTTQVYDANNLSTATSGLLPRISLEHQWTPDIFLYGSYTKGAKFAGFNRAAESLLSAQVAANPERVTTYELGSKGRFFDGKLTASAALFYNQYRDYLASLSNSVVNGVVVTDPVLVNAGRAKTYGLDVELAGQLARQTQWTLAAEFLQARFDQFANPTGAAASNFTGNDLPYAAHVSLSASLRHLVPMSGGGALALTGSVQYTAPQFTDVANTPDLKSPEQTYVNVDATYTDPNGRWSVSLRIKNLLNKTYALVRTRIAPVGVDSVFYNAPRTALLTARYSF